MRISEGKREKISEQILGVLYSFYPKPVFTYKIAQEIARDEEFVKSLLINLKEKRLLLEIKKNPKGVVYLRRSRWKLNDGIYKTYKNHQKSQLQWTQ